MFTAVSIENLRAIRTGQLSDFVGLNLFTGPNGCGKSTVLDALLIAGHPDLPQGVTTALQRRSTVILPGRWLVRGANPKNQAGIILKGEFGVHFVELRLLPEVSSGARALAKAAGEDCDVVFNASGSTNDGSAKRRHGYQLSITPSGRAIPAASEAEWTNEYGLRVVDPSRQGSLTLAHSAAVRDGRKTQVVELLSELNAGVIGLEGADDGGTPSLYVTYPGRGVPIGLAGDGVQALADLALNLAAPEGSVLLVEEPEVFLHPKGIWLAAKALLAAQRRGVQLFVTTHSEELIESILDQATDEDLARMATYRLGLRDGALESTRFAGADAKRMVDTIGSDFR